MGGCLQWRQMVSVCVADRFSGSESLSQRHFFLGTQISIVERNDSCHVRRYCWKHQARSELAACLTYPNIRYVLDR